MHPLLVDDLFLKISPDSNFHLENKAIKSVAQELKDSLLLYEDVSIS